MKLFDDLVNIRTSFKILENSGHGHTSIFQNPYAAQLARCALDSRTL